jgi:hypothetical protein
MALQAIVSGARPRLRRPPDPGVHAADAKAGWNWTYWDRISVRSSSSCRPTTCALALVAPKATATVKAGIRGVEVATRQEGRTLWVLAARRDGSTSTVGFTGLPSRHDGRSSRAARS